MIHYGMESTPIAIGRRAKPVAMETVPDIVLDGLVAVPFRVRRPAIQSVPFVFASPHSGCAYPASFVAQSRLDIPMLRRSEDAFVDALFASAVGMGAPLIAANFPRAYLDANRAPAELDETMFAGSIGRTADAASPRVQAGLGVIPRIVREGADIYRARLSPVEAGFRLDAFHTPYHAALQALADATVEKFGMAIVVDCHSMPWSPSLADIVLGDRHGLAATPQLAAAAEAAFVRQGFSVARNVPYAGGYTTERHGRPARRRFALQIELNRALYLDEDRVVPAPGFDTVQKRIAASLRGLLDAAGDWISQRRGIAAE
jgi:N-formylglutamate deformylase